MSARCGGRSRPRAASADTPRHPAHGGARVPRGMRISRVLSPPGWRRIISLGRPSRDASCGLPGTRSGRTTPRPCAALLRTGFAVRPAVTRGPVRSCRTLSPLPVPRRAIGGLLSVALSIASRRPGVTRRPVLRSSDFPPPATEAPTAILTRMPCGLFTRRAEVGSGRLPPGGGAPDVKSTPQDAWRAVGRNWLVWATSGVPGAGAARHWGGRDGSWRRPLSPLPRSRPLGSS